MNNNPVRYNDPTGHMADDGCSGDTEGCQLTDLQKAIDAQAQKRGESDKAKRLCKAGNEDYCSPAVVLGGLITGELKLGWDPSLVPWEEVGMDVAGITADVIVFTEPSVTYLEGAKALNGATSAVEFYTNVWGLAQDKATGTKPDLVNVFLDFASVVPGPIGAVSSALGLVWNLSQGFYIH